MNHIRNEKQDSFRSRDGTSWIKPNSDEWKTFSSKGANLALVGKNSDPSVMSGIRKKDANEPDSIFKLIRQLAAYPTDALAKFIGWFTTWN